MIGFDVNLSRFQFLIKIHTNVCLMIIIEPNRPAHHCISTVYLFVCIQMKGKAAQTHSRQNMTIEFGYKDFDFSFFSSPR